MRSKIKLFFTDFWPTFDIENNYFTNLLSVKYDLEITKDHPDFILYSCFGFNFRKYNCRRIFFTGENIRPNFNDCDYSFSFDYDDNPRSFRLPLYALYTNMEDFTKTKEIDVLMNQKMKFCNFIYSNPTPKYRIKFFKKLSKYKKVDSGGRVLNNIGYYVKDKIEFLKDYKFTISFENELYPGYTTEKILEPMIAGSLPIYWGNPLVSRDFNTKSFLNFHDFKDEDELIEKIIELDRDDDKYREYLKQPWFRNNEINEFVAKENILGHFDRIFNEEIIPVSSKSKIFSENKIISQTTWFNYFLRYKFKRIIIKIKNFSFKKFKIKFDKIRGK